MAIGSRIRELRRTLDLTQQEFADRIGSKRNTVATYEIHRTEPSAAVISLICREFHVSENWLRFGIGEMYDPPDDDATTALAREFGLDDFLQGIVREYMNLRSDQKKAVQKFVCGIVEEMKKVKNSDVFPAPDLEPVDIDARVEAYRQELLAEKKSAEVSPDSSSSPAEN